MFKIDTHVHTSEVSACAHLSADETVRLYKEAGYSAIIITDHYCPEFFDALKDMPWDKKIEAYLKGYENAKEAGERYSLKVYLGMEIRFREVFNDYLVYGFDKDFLLGYENAFEAGLVKYKKYCKDNGVLLIQAHPYRAYITPVDFSHLDGMEVYNLNPRHQSFNTKAVAEAKNHAGWVATSGSDCHEVQDVGLGGIVAKFLPEDEVELANLLRSNDYRLIY